MLTIFAMILSYVYELILCMFLFSRMLERRYSYQITTAGTLIGSSSICLMKIPFYFFAPSFNAGLLNLAGIGIMIIYQVVLFRAALVKRVLALVFYYVYMFSGEMVTMNITCLIFGRNEIMQLESNYTLTGVILMSLWATLFFYPVLCLWELLLKAEHHRRRGHLWLCVLLPLDQFLLMEYFVQTYEAERLTPPVWSVGGIILGILADVYMFFLFYRENRQFQLSQELLEEQELYRREQLYYEHLKESQEETARIRHDYQNYILVLRNMIQKRGDNNT